MRRGVPSPTLITHTAASLHRILLLEGVQLAHPLHPCCLLTFLPWVRRPTCACPTQRGARLIGRVTSDTTVGG